MADEIATAEPPTTAKTETLDKVVIRFAGDSGDGMQVAGSRFTDASALFGNDLATLPSFPAEIRAPAGTLAGVSAFQVQISDHEITTPGDAPDVLVVMNPAALRKELGRLAHGATLIVNTDAFDEGDIAVVRRGACEFQEKADAAASIGAMVIAPSVGAAPTTDKKQQAAELQDQIEASDVQLSALAEKLHAAEARRDEANQTVQNAETQIEQTEAEVAQIIDLVRERVTAGRTVFLSSHELDQVGGVGEVAARVAAVGGRIARQRQDVAHARGRVLVEQLGDLAAGVTRAGQVGHRGERLLVVDLHDDVARAVTGGTTGAVGDRHERRAQGRQLVDGLLELALGLVGLRGEELEAERLPGGQQVGDLLARVRGWHGCSPR